MATKLEIHDTAETLGAALAADILALAARQRPLLLGCPGGRSLRTTYRALGRLAAQHHADLSGLVIVMMDEYLVPQGGHLVRCDPAAHYSCLRFAREEIRAPLNAGLPPARQVPEASVWMPDPADPAAYDRRIAQAGGIALFLLASGASDGHVAFNPPGSPRDSRTRIIALPETTRRDNLATFPQFRGLDEVPAHGISVGIATIAEQSRAAALVVTGAHKRLAAARVTAATAYDPNWPATVVHDCASARILLDRAAAP